MQLCMFVFVGAQDSMRISCNRSSICYLFWTNCMYWNSPMLRESCSMLDQQTSRHENHTNNTTLTKTLNLSILLMLYGMCQPMRAVSVCKPKRTGLHCGIHLRRSCSGGECARTIDRWRVSKFPYRNIPNVVDRATWRLFTSVCTLRFACCCSCPTWVRTNSCMVWAVIV